ncbi:MAG: hypothetical protein E7270_00235 [Lachnospiraceae bacterium]|nr:hypothetical protein [Lachnospiraceae bacterium]
MITKITRVLKAVCFMVIFCLLLGKVTDILYPLDATYMTYDSYYDLKEDTVDVVFLGTSCTYNAWVVPQMWSEAGISAFTLASSAQPFGMNVEIIENALKTQSPKYIIMDLHGFKSESYNYDESRTRPVIDNFPLITRLRYVDGIINEAKKYSEETDKELDLDNSDYSYYLPIIKYHTRWKEEITHESFTGKPCDYLGYYNVIGSKKIEKTTVTSEVGVLDDYQIEALNKIMDFGKENEDITLIFTCMPSRLNEEEQKDINAAFKILKENGYDVINMNTDEMYTELGMSFDKDLRDRNHLNIFGAEKVTEYLVNYLKENYDIEDHRGDSKYDAWDNASNNFDKEYDKIIYKQLRTPKLNRVEFKSGEVVRVVWNRVHCADGYVIFKKDTTSGEWMEFNRLDDSQINYVDDKIDAGEEATYTVCAYKMVDGKAVYGAYDEIGITATR